MPAPSKSWVGIIDGQVDSDSPVDSILMTALRDDLVHLREWLGGSYTAQVNHMHNGVDSAALSYPDGSITTVKIADANVTTAKLKFVQGSYSTTLNQTNYYISTGAAYVHLPRIILVGTTSVATLAAELTGNGDGTYHTQFKLNFTTGGSCTVYWEAHTN